MGDFVGDVLGKPDAPQPPDYAAAAREQGVANLDAAIATGVLARPNEINPFGSRTWNQTGSYNVGGREIPIFTGTTSLTPSGQNLLDKDYALRTGLMGTGMDALKQVQSSLSRPFDLSKNRDALTDTMYRRYTRLLDPRFKQAESDLRTDLVNRGFSLGNEGYTKAMDDFQRSKEATYGDAMDRATTGGAQQAIAEALLERQQPLQELNALRTGAQPQMPNFQAYGGAGPVQAAPNFAATQAQGNAAMQQYGIDAGMFNSFMQALGGGVGAYYGAR